MAGRCGWIATLSTSAGLGWLWLVSYIVDLFFHCSSLCVLPCLVLLSLGVRCSVLSKAPGPAQRSLHCEACTTLGVRCCGVCLLPDRCSGLPFVGRRIVVSVVDVGHCRRLFAICDVGVPLGTGVCRVGECWSNLCCGCLLRGDRWLLSGVLLWEFDCGGGCQHANSCC